MTPHHYTRGKPEPRVRGTASDGSLGKVERLLKPADFRAAYKKGRSFKKDAFVMILVRNGYDYNRIGFSISSKSVKAATARNRIRRRLREIYRLNKKNLNAGFDIVIVVKKDISKTVSYKLTEGLFLALARDARLLNKR